MRRSSLDGGRNRLHGSSQRPWFWGGSPHCCPATLLDEYLRVGRPVVNWLRASPRSRWVLSFRISRSDSSGDLHCQQRRCLGSLGKRSSTRSLRSSRSWPELCGFVASTFRCPASSSSPP